VLGKHVCHCFINRGGRKFEQKRRTISTFLRSQKAKIAINLKAHAQWTITKDSSLKREVIVKRKSTRAEGERGN